MLKRGATGEGLRPKFSILNPALTQTLPAYQTAAGITDIMAHLFERYFTNTKEVEATDRVIEGLLMTMIHEGPRAVADPDNYEARANIMWAGMLAHNNCCGVGREQDWASHDIEHELSAVYDCTHGAGLAVVVPAWMTYNMKHDVMRFAQLASRVWGCPMDFANPERTALQGIEALRNFTFHHIGMEKAIFAFNCGYSSSINSTNHFTYFFPSSLKESMYSSTEQKLILIFLPCMILVCSFSLFMSIFFLRFYISNFIIQACATALSISKRQKNIR